MMLLSRRFLGVSSLCLISATSPTWAQVEVIDQSVSSSELPPVQRQSNSQQYRLPPAQPQAPSQENRSGVYRGAIEQAAPQKRAAAAASSQPTAQQQGELFYQLQLLQEEVRNLRGLVEEQQYQIKQMQVNSIERYSELDQRVAALMSQTSTDNKATVASPDAANTGRATADNNNVNDDDDDDSVQGKKSYQQAYNLVLARKFDQALNAFKAFQIAYPKSAYLPNSEYWLGELYQVQSPPNLPLAAQAFTRLIAEYPQHDKIPDALYKLGKVYYALDRKSEAKLYLEKLVKEYSDSNHTAVAKGKQFLQDNF